MQKKIILSLITLFAIAICIVIINKREDHGLNQLRSSLNDSGFFLFNSERILAPISIQTLDGDDTDLAAASNKWQLVNFGYMYCPDICPINLRLMSDVKKQWKAKGLDDLFDITHITFDPERDTVDRLKPYLDYIDDSFIGLTGELDNIRKVAQQLNTVFIHEKPDEYGNYFITHSDSIALLNPEGKYIGLFKGPYNKEAVLQALEILIL